jgi:hypothetical protein
MNIEKYSKLAWNELTMVGLTRNYNHVSIILRNNDLVSLGINRRKTHPLAMRYGYRNQELHSELDALIKIPKIHRNNLVLLNFRFDTQGELKMSKPCSLCMPWCVATFDEIYYSVPDGLVQMVL